MVWTDKAKIQIVIIFDTSKFELSRACETEQAKKTMEGDFVVLITSLTCDYLRPGVPPWEFQMQLRIRVKIFCAVLQLCRRNTGDRPSSQDAGGVSMPGTDSSQIAGPQLTGKKIFLNYVLIKRSVIKSIIFS